MHFYSQNLLDFRFFKWSTLLLATLLFSVGCLSDPVDVDEDEIEEPFRYNRVPGYSAQAFLTDSTFTELEIEIDYMPQHKPAQRAIDSLKQFLEKRLHKTSITFNIADRPIPTLGTDSYTDQNIVELEERFRGTRNDEGKLSTYVVIVDGKFDQDENTLGIAYYNTSIVLFGDNLEENTDALGKPPRHKLEATVLRHELGHLMGLVGIGTPMQNNHNTQQHPSHCRYQDCLMYYAVETTDVVDNLFNSSIPNLDPQCLNDLKANGGK